MQGEHQQPPTLSPPLLLAPALYSRRPAQLQKVKLLHPDSGGSEAEFVRVLEAYKVGAEAHLRRVAPPAVAAACRPGRRTSWSGPPRLITLRGSLPHFLGQVLSNPRARQLYDLSRGHAAGPRVLRDAAAAGVGGAVDPEQDDVDVSMLWACC